METSFWGVKPTPHPFAVWSTTPNFKKLLYICYVSGPYTSADLYAEPIPRYKTFASSIPGAAIYVFKWIGPDRLSDVYVFRRK